MRKVYYSLLILSFLAIPSHSQEIAKTEVGIKFLKGWKRHKVYTIRLAEAMTENGYSFKPVESIRSFAEAIMHVITANYMFSSIVGESKFPLSEEDQKIEGKSKADLLRMLGESFDYAEKVVLNITNNQLKKTTTWQNPIEPSTTRTYEEVLYVMREHAAHHRGQLTVYLRLKGIVPPDYID